MDLFTELGRFVRHDKYFPVRIDLTQSIRILSYIGRHMSLAREAVGELCTALFMRYGSYEHFCLMFFDKSARAGRAVLS